MRVLFLTASGHAWSDTVGLDFDNIQEPDGLHPLTNAAIFNDIKRKESVTFISARTTIPIGELNTDEQMKRLVFQRFLMIVARRGHRVSRIWSRRFVNLAFFLIRGLYFGWFMGFVMLLVYIPVRLVFG